MKNLIYLNPTLEELQVIYDLAVEKNISVYDGPDDFIKNDEEYQSVLYDIDCEDLCRCDNDSDHESTTYSNISTFFNAIESTKDQSNLSKELDEYFN